MGVTGSNAGTKLSSNLPDLLARIRQFTPVPLAVGFGVDNRSHFESATDAGADAVVVGSRIIKVVLEGHEEGDAPKALEKYCREISLKDSPDRKPLGRLSANATPTDANGAPKPSPVLPIPSDEPLNKEALEVKGAGKLPSRFGIFGGAYVPESLVDCLAELEAAYVEAKEDPSFWKEFEDLYGYMNRPSELYLAERLTEEMGGAKIWLK